MTDYFFIHIKEGVSVLLRKQSLVKITRTQVLQRYFILS